MGVEVQNPNPLSAFQSNAASAVPKHVRKTIAFDGSANNGNLGDIVPLFTITGRVLVMYVSPYVSEALVCSAPTGVELILWAGTTSDIGRIGSISYQADFTGAVGVMTPEDGPQPVAPYGFMDAGIPCAANIGMYVKDAVTPAGADITDGTIIIDIWYYPITDDGALVAA